MGYKYNEVELLPSARCKHTGRKEVWGLNRLLRAGCVGGLQRQEGAASIRTRCAGPGTAVWKARRPHVYRLQSSLEGLLRLGASLEESLIKRRQQQLQQVYMQDSSICKALQCIPCSSSSTHRLCHSLLMSPIAAICPVPSSNGRRHAFVASPRQAHRQSMAHQVSLQVRPKMQLAYVCPIYL